MLIKNFENLNNNFLTFEIQNLHLKKIIFNKFSMFETHFKWKKEKKFEIPLFRQFYIPQNQKIFHGIPPLESSFYKH